MLEQQLQRLKLEETQQHHRDQSTSQELHEAQVALLQKEQILKETYRREEKNAKSTQRLKNQIEALLKEQTKLILKIKEQSAESELSAKARDEMQTAATKSKEREKQLEFKINSFSQQLRTVNEMVQKLKEAMPSADLRGLVQSMQDVTRLKFELGEEYSQKEHELLQNEN